MRKKPGEFPSWQQRFVSVAFFVVTAKEPSHVSSVCLYRARNSHEAAFLPTDSAIGDRDRQCTYHAARSLLGGRNCCRSQGRSAIAVLDRLRGFQFLTLPFHSSAAPSRKEFEHVDAPFCDLCRGSGQRQTNTAGSKVGEAPQPTFVQLPFPLGSEENLSDSAFVYLFFLSHLRNEAVSLSVGRLVGSTRN